MGKLFHLHFASEEDSAESSVACLQSGNFATMALTITKNTRFTPSNSPALSRYLYSSSFMCAGAGTALGCAWIGVRRNGFMRVVDNDSAR